VRIYGVSSGWQLKKGGPLAWGLDGRLQPLTAKKKRKYVTKCYAGFRTRPRSLGLSHDIRFGIYPA
jgi:hypothetical protein